MLLGTTATARLQPLAAAAHTCRRSAPDRSITCDTAAMHQCRRNCGSLVHMALGQLAAACAGLAAGWLLGRQRRRQRSRGAKVFDMDPRLLEGKHEVGSKWAPCTAVGVFRIPGAECLQLRA